MRQTGAQPASRIDHVVAVLSFRLPLPERATERRRD
jgi:hypothetical protein